MEIFENLNYWLLIYLLENNYFSFPKKISKANKIMLTIAIMYHPVEELLVISEVLPIIFNKNVK